MTSPITPDDAEQASYQSIPAFVVAAFNAEISANYSMGASRVIQRCVVERIKGSMPNAMAFDNRWLNIEELYRANGWTVTYDKPGYNESHEASFAFKKARR